MGINSEMSLLLLTYFPQVVVGVHVRDINDNDPVLLNLPNNTSVSEGAPIHTSVARVRAKDADSGRNALLTYNITAGNQDGAFYVNDTVKKKKGRVEGVGCGGGGGVPWFTWVRCDTETTAKETSGLPLHVCICQTGVVQVNRPLDRERVAEYRLTITVKDNPENARIARRVLSLPPHSHISSAAVSFMHY